jgi:hypothetical protein
MVMDYLESLASSFVPQIAATGLDMLLPGEGFKALVPFGLLTDDAPRNASAPTVRAYNAGSQRFFQLQNGKVGTFKKNGVWKEWRPYRPVVVPKKWDAKSMGRVARALDRQKKTAVKIVNMSGGTATMGRSRK